jgi:hypothetical protein
MEVASSKTGAFQQAPMLKARFTIPTAKVLVDRIVAEAEEIIERRLSSMICA